MFALWWKRTTSHFWGFLPSCISFSLKKMVTATAVGPVLSPSKVRRPGSEGDSEFWWRGSRALSWDAHCKHCCAASCPSAHQSFFCACFSFSSFYCCTKSLLEIMNANGRVANSNAAQQEGSSWALNDEFALLQHQGFSWKDQGSIWWGSVWINNSRALSLGDKECAAASKTSKRGEGMRVKEENCLSGTNKAICSA